MKKLYIFEKPLTMSFQICKNFCQILINLIFNQEKLKMCPLTGCLQKICNFFRKTCAIRFLMSKAFQKAKFYQNLTSGSGSKQRFSLLQEKAVIQAVCLRTQLKPSFRPKGRALGMQEKSENFNSLRPILFELCKKKLQRGRVKFREK